MVSPENPNWVFDYALLEDISVPGGDLPSLDPPGVLWSSHSFSTGSATDANPHSVEFNDSLRNSDGLKEAGSRKRVRPESCSSSGSKACREKMRRDRLNDRFLELSYVLDPGRSPKVDKSLILVEAVRMVNQLRDEARKLEELNQDLQEKVNELKAEKNELRDEKQRLKTDKESLERQVKALGSQPGFLPHLPAIAAPFSAPAQVVGGKLVPFVSYPGVSMWQFMPPAAVDTSQDHVLRPPVA
ncbi:transcription factor bHLH115-like [Carica papaya]|uniref:transcription factor bHLH115-like n=1 Tax=Carica papaya TaxID=3649 RepID=UPI000B8C81A9|nr:transcription factor bHLH115-like [Carica papaya]